MLKVDIVRAEDLKTGALDEIVKVIIKGNAKSSREKEMEEVSEMIEELTAYLNFIKELSDDIYEYFSQTANKIIK